MPAPSAVLSFDHDGCLGLPGLIPKDVSKTHAPLIEHLKRQQAQQGYLTQFVSSGSNRQGIFLDCLNAIQNQNNIAAPVLQALSAALGAYFDPFRMADLTAGNKAGETNSQVRHFAKIHGVNLLSTVMDDDLLFELMKMKHPGFDFSIDKTNILYAQLQRAGFIKGPVDFHLYDDLIGTVLSPLAKIYTEYPEFIPKQVTLHLHHFDTVETGERASNDDKEPTLVKKIEGTGEHDVQYAKTIEAMGVIARQEEPGSKSYKMAGYVTPERVQDVLSNLADTAPTSTRKT
jgi:hypothetical protein